MLESNQVEIERDRALGYLVLRVCLGINIAMHGISRLLSGSSHFVDNLHKQFGATVLPMWSVSAFGYALPWMEGAIGLLIILGLKTRAALLAGGAVIAVLTFGITLVQQWDVAGIQLVYAVAFALLVFCHRFDTYSMDRKASDYLLQAHGERRGCVR